MNSRELKLLDHAAERVALDEDIWSVMKWLLAALGIRLQPRFVEYKMLNARHVKGRSLYEMARLALKRTLTISERKRLEVIPIWDKKMIVVRRDVRVPGSTELADKVVNYLIQMGAKET